MVSVQERVKFFFAFVSADRIDVAAIIARRAQPPKRSAGMSDTQYSLHRVSLPVPMTVWSSNRLSELGVSERGIVRT